MMIKDEVVQIIIMFYIHIILNIPEIITNHQEIIVFMQKL